MCNTEGLPAFENSCADCYGCMQSCNYASCLPLVECDPYACMQGFVAPPYPYDAGCGAFDNALCSYWCEGCYNPVVPVPCTEQWIDTQCCDVPQLVSRESVAMPNLLLSQPEQAHEIGRQLADEVLQGKYPYVLTTHIDKGNVHNHVIFCAVDMVNQRKYVSNRQSYAYIRRTSDRLCKEHGLSVVMPGQDRGKSYAEWDAHRKGTSWKAKLKAAIDAAIPQAKDFDDFLRLLQEQSYEVKRGKYVSFRAPGQERFTRCKTLGETYTEEAITSSV